MAAFFSRIFRMGQVVVDHPANMDLGTKDVGGSMDLLHPRTHAVVKPAVLDSSPLAVTPDGNPRKELAHQMMRLHRGGFVSRRCMIASSIRPLPVRPLRPENLHPPKSLFHGASRSPRVRFAV